MFANLFDLRAGFENNTFEGEIFSNNTFARSSISSNNYMYNNNFLCHLCYGNYILYTSGILSNDVEVRDSFSFNLFILNSRYGTVHNRIKGTTWENNVFTGIPGVFFGAGNTGYNVININYFKSNKITASIINNTFTFDQTNSNNVTSLSSALYGQNHTLLVRNNAIYGRYFNNNTMIVSRLTNNPIINVFSDNVGTNNLQNNNFNGTFQYNVLNGHLSGNKFENNIHSNTFGDNFTGNTVLSSFEYNEVGTNCSNNVFEKNNSYNTFNTGFASNSTCDYFTKNVTEPGVTGLNLASPAAPTHVRNQYNTTLFKNSNDAVRLRYFNNDDQLVVTDPQI